MDKPEIDFPSEKLAGNSKSNSDETILKVIILAENQVKQGHFDQALEKLNQGAALKPDFAKIYTLRAEVYRQKGQFYKALADLNKTIELNPEDGLAFLQRGEIFRLLKQPQPALDDLNQAVSLLPNNAIALGRRGTLYRNLKNFTLALADYNLALELAPTNTWLYGNRAETYRGLKDYPRAIHDYTQVLKLNPAASWVYERRSYPNLWAGHLERARSDFEAAWKANPADIMNGWMAEWVGMCQPGFSFANSNEMRERLKALANANPQHYAALLSRASLYWWQQVALRESYKQAELACTKEPGQAEGYFWKGLAAGGLKEDAEAVFLLQRALDLGLPPALFAPLEWLKKINPELHSNVFNLLGVAKPVAEKSPQAAVIEPLEQIKTRPADISEFIKTEPKAQLAATPIKPAEVPQPETIQKIAPEKTTPAVQPTETEKDTAKLNGTPESIRPEIAPPEPSPAPVPPPLINESSVSSLKKSPNITVSLLKPALVGIGLLIAGLLIFLLVLNPGGEKAPAGSNPVAVKITATVPNSPASASVLSPGATATPGPGQPAVSVADTSQPGPTAVLAIYSTPPAAADTVSITKITTALTPNSQPPGVTATPPPAATLTASPSSSPSTGTVTVAATASPAVTVSASPGPVPISPVDTQLLTGHSGIVTTAGWSRDGRYFATGSEDKTIKVWETATHKEVLTLAPKNAAQAGNPVALSWSSNNEYLASGWTDNHVRVFRVFPASATSNKNETAGQITTEVTDNVLPQTVAFSPDNILVTYPGKDVLHTQNNSSNTKGPDFLLGQVTPVSAVAFSPDNKFLAAGLTDGRTIIWDRTTLKTVLAILPDQNGGSNPIDVIDWTTDNKYLVAGSQKNLTVYQISLTGGGKIINIPLNQAVKAPVRALSLSADNKLLGVGFQNGDMQLWSIEQNQLVGQVNSGAEAILSLNFNSDNHQVSAISGGNRPVVINYLRP